MSANDRFSVSNRFVADLPSAHLIDVPATGISGPQASATERLPRAVQLPAPVDLPRVIATEVDPHDMSLVLQSLGDTPSKQRSRQFSFAIRALLVICVMGAPLAFIFVFASAQQQIDLASMWTAFPIGTAKTPPIESEGFAVRTGSD